MLCPAVTQPPRSGAGPWPPCLFHNFGPLCFSLLWLSQHCQFAVSKHSIYVPWWFAIPLDKVVWCFADVFRSSYFDSLSTRGFFHFFFILSTESSEAFSPLFCLDFANEVPPFRPLAVLFLDHAVYYPRAPSFWYLASPYLSCRRGLPGWRTISSCCYPSPWEFWHSRTQGLAYPHYPFVSATTLASRILILAC